MIINCSDEPIVKGKKSIFLAGPTKRNSNLDESWRKEACSILKELGFDGIVYIPEFRSGNNPVELTVQAEWEREGLITADAIVFYVCRNFPEMPGLTTNIEYGMWLTKKPNNCVLCCPYDSNKNDYLEWLYIKEKPNGIIHRELKDVLKEAVEICNKVG